MHRYTRSRKQRTPSAWTCRALLPSSSSRCLVVAAAATPSRYSPVSYPALLLPLPFTIHLHVVGYMLRSFYFISFFSLQTFISWGPYDFFPPPLQTSFFVCSCEDVRRSTCSSRWGQSPPAASFLCFLGSMWCLSSKQQRDKDGRASGQCVRLPGLAWLEANKVKFSVLCMFEVRFGHEFGPVSCSSLTTIIICMVSLFKSVENVKVFIQFGGGGEQRNWCNGVFSVLNHVKYYLSLPCSENC